MENKYEKNIEALLQKVFLEQDLAAPKNDALLNASAGATLKKGFSFGQIFLNNWIGIMTLLGVFIVSVLGLSATFKAESKYSPSSFAYELPKNVTVQEMTELPTQSVKLLKQDVVSPKVKRQITKLYAQKPAPKREKKVYSPEKVAVNIPVLSEDGKKKHLKAKEKYLKAIMKFDKKKVSRVNTNSQFVQNENKPLSSFIMWSTEISNSEYRLFLNDLILQNRKEEYASARVDSAAWTGHYKKSFFEPMRNMYGWHPGYDNYPLVNVSVEGARLFCKWLAEEITGTFHDKEILEVRLPTERQWEYAASSGQKFRTYPWGGPSVQNDKGCYLANFKPGVDATNSCLNGEKSMDDVALNDKIKKSPYVADGGLITVRVDSYNPNGLGLYNMSGNVSEMVVNTKSGKVGVKGGSWEDDKEELKIKAPMQREGQVVAHPTIGFRPIIIYRKKDEAGRAYREVIQDPSLSEQQIKENSKRKDKMIQQIVNVDHDYYTSLLGGAFSLNEELVNVKKIIAKKHEVSMIEYKTFLFDLIRQKRFEEFHKVKPIDAPLGVDSGFYNLFMHDYFFHPAYDKYPVLNITVEGAELFCKWLSTEVIKSSKRKGNHSFRGVRIPTYEEWMYLVASNERIISNQLGKNLPRIDMMNIKSGRDSARQIYDGAVFTNYVDSYVPNSGGLYNMIGNVAEIVKYKNGTYGSKGGSWNSTENDLGQENFTKGTLKPNAMTGFRIVLELDRTIDGN